MSRTQNISVSLTLEQWVAIMGQLTGKELSPEGLRLFNEAKEIIADGVQTAVKEPKKVKLDIFV